VAVVVQHAGDAHRREKPGGTRKAEQREADVWRQRGREKEGEESGGGEEGVGLGLETL
jgi:hypothetical protein